MSGASFPILKANSTLSVGKSNYKHMFETSADILNWVLAACVAILTIFICWTLYYLLASLHKIYNLVRRIEMGMEKAEELIDTAREKLRHSGAYFMILGEVAKRAMDFVKEKKSKDKKK